MASAGRAVSDDLVPLDLSEHLTVERPEGTLKSQLGLSADTPLVGSVGRLVPIKDLSTLLKAMLHVPGVHLAVLGDGESRRELEELSRDLGLTQRVHSPVGTQTSPG